MKKRKRGVDVHRKQAAKYTDYQSAAGNGRCEQSTLSGSFLHSFSGVAIGSDELWNCFKGNIGETSERWGGVHMGFSECIDTILN